MLQQLTVETPQQWCETAGVFHIGIVVRTLRERCGWTGEELARRAQVSPTTISKIENGADRFQRRTIGKIAKGLGVSEADLYAWESEQRVRLRTEVVSQLSGNKDVASPPQQIYPATPSPGATEAVTEGVVEMADDPEWAELRSCFSLLSPDDRTRVLRHARALTATTLTERNRGGAEAHQRKKVGRR